MSIFRHFRHVDDHSHYLRNFIFGVEDSLVSTVGLLAGVAAAAISQSAIVTTGLVLIVVEGFSMGVGSFLTEETTEEMEGSKPETWGAIRGAAVMLVSYCLAGLLPLAPYTFLIGNTAAITSVILSLCGLLLLGYGTSWFYHRPHPLRHAIKMFILGGSAVLVGILVGKLFQV